MCFFTASEGMIPGFTVFYMHFFLLLLNHSKYLFWGCPRRIPFRWQVGSLSWGIPFCTACFLGYCCNPPVELTFSQMICLSFKWCRDESTGLFDSAQRSLSVLRVLPSVSLFARLTYSIFTLYFTKERVRIWNSEEKSQDREVNSLLSWHSRHFKVAVVWRLKEP